MKIPISFKESEKEIFDFIKSKLSPSVYIKELVLEDMKKSSKKEEGTIVKRKRSLDIDV